MWPAEHLLYRRALAAALAAPALMVPVFTGQPFVGDAGLRVAVAMPGQHQLAPYTRLELDFTLGCPGPRDADCPLWVGARPLRWAALMPCQLRACCMRLPVKRPARACQPSACHAPFLPLPTPCQDHVIQVFVCCDAPDGSPGDCDPCRPTAWMPLGAPTTQGARAGGRFWLLPRRAACMPPTPCCPGHAAPPAGAAHAPCFLPARRQGAGCGAPAVRPRAGPLGVSLQVSWAPTTACAKCRLHGLEAAPQSAPEALHAPPPKRRVRNGRWLTDATGKLPLLTPGQQCTFTAQSAPWAGTWTATLSLRFSTGERRFSGPTPARPRPPHPQPLPAPSRLLPLPFSGGAFDAAYNTRWGAYTFATPPRLLRATIESVISGARGGRWAWLHAWCPLQAGSPAPAHQECLLFCSAPCRPRQ